MKKFFYFAMTVLLLTISFAGCNSEEDVVKERKQVNRPNDEKKSQDEEPNKDDENKDNGNENRDPNSGDNSSRTIILTDAQKVAVSKNNDFAFNFYRQLIQQQELNLKEKSNIVSPLSVTYAMGMVNDGARGKTAEEITKMLGFDDGSAQDINELCKQLIDNAPFVDEQVTLKLADCIITNLGIDLSEQYQKDMTDYYQAETFCKDFSQKSTVDFINDWCDKHTEGMIKKIIDQLDPMAQMVLMNAIYFKAAWSGKFKKEETKDEMFTGDNGMRTVPMMHRLDATEYTTNSTYATIGLPYGTGKNWRMYVLLPNLGKTVGDVLNSLSNKMWSENVAQMYGEYVDVKLPKFKTESDIDLNEVLKALGAPTMFTSSADFTAMTKQQRELFVGLIKQKAAIEVSEEGTEASAVTIATYVEDNGGDGGGTPILQFHADHPFVYLIQEASSGAIFFIGTYHGN